MEMLKNKINFRVFGIYIFVIFIMLLQYKWFFIPSNFNNFFIKFNTDFSSTLISLVIIVSLLFIILMRRGKINIKSYEFGLYVISLVFFFLIEIIYTSIKYPLENLPKMISYHLYFLVPLLYFTLLYFFRTTKNGYDFFVSMFTIFNIILSFLMLITGIIFRRDGTILLNFFSYNDIVRNGSIRIFSGFGNITTSFFISLCFVFLSKKNKILHLLNLFFSFFAIVFVLQTRVQTIITLMILLIAFILTLNPRRITIKHIILLIIGIVIFILLLKYHIFEKLLFSPSEVSFTYRIESYYYFTKLGLTNLLGIGLLTDYNPIYSTILHGPNLTSHITDVGLVGLFGKLGVFIVVWYFGVICKYYKISKNCKNKFKYSSIIIVIYLILTSFTLCNVTYSSIIFFPFSMAIFEYEFKKGENKNERY